MTDLEQSKYQVSILARGITHSLIIINQELRMASQHLRTQNGRMGQARAVDHKQQALLAQRPLARAGASPI